MNLLNLFIDDDGEYQAIITIADRSFTPQQLHNFVVEAMCHEARARNIVTRRSIPKTHDTEPAVHACLSHLDNLR